MAESRIAHWTIAIGQNLAASAVLAVGGGVAVWLAKLTPVVSKYAPLSYLGTFLVAVILLLLLGNLAVALWHRFNPPPVRTGLDPALPSPEQYDDGDLRRAIEALRKETVENKALMSRVASDMDRVRLKGQGELAQKIDDLGRRVESLGEKQKEHRQRASEALHTIYLRERLAHLEVEIQQDASDLYDRLKAGEVYDAQKWEQWENVHGHWEQKLGEWLGNATWYGLAVKERTLTVDEAKYATALWTMSRDQFPDDEAMRRFKKFRIVHRQWEDIISEVRTGMEQVAFLGMTQSEVRHGRPAG